MTDLFNNPVRHHFRRAVLVNHQLRLAILADRRCILFVNFSVVKAEGAEHSHGGESLSECSTVKRIAASCKTSGCEATPTTPERLQGKYGRKQSVSRLSNSGQTFRPVCYTLAAQGNLVARSL